MGFNSGFKGLNIYWEETDQNEDIEIVVFGSM